jgi:hypothetical protein
MNDQLFRDLFRALHNEVSERAITAKEEDRSIDYDKWSAVRGLLDAARHRMSAA